MSWAAGLGVTASLFLFLLVLIVVWSSDNKYNLSVPDFHGIRQKRAQPLKLRVLVLPVFVSIRWALTSCGLQAHENPTDARCRCENIPAGP